MSINMVTLKKLFVVHLSCHHKNQKDVKMTITSNFILLKINIIFNLQEVHEHQPSLEVQVIQHLLSGLAHQPLP